MEFRTAIKPERSALRIAYNDSLFLLGSCFASEIGSWLKRTKFNVTINPFGVLYNPASVAGALRILIGGQTLSNDDLFCYRGRYLSFRHDTSFSNPDPFVALDKINKSIAEGSRKLKTASCLFITFGTARIYRLKSNNEIVSNCHKIPAGEFTREILGQDDIADQWSTLLADIREYNPALKIIFTVSPVRHWKDGAYGNQLSKSVLFVAIDKIIKQNPGTSYFPGYELVMDDLRDYRYYADDLLHPSSMAVEYIWDFFKASYFDTDTGKLADKILKITRAYEHITGTSDIEELRLFGRNMLEKIDAIVATNKEIDLSAEREYFSKLV
ncbi:MAG: GSCFA domain-containing protein [Marinilabiliaceae bacterium]|jgi:hypothetical protein|nr:GSCFA domain-containing protein [Marinilabiliaceae bacterium]